MQWLVELSSSLDLFPYLSVACTLMVGPAEDGREWGDAMAAACRELQLNGQVAIVHPPLKNGEIGRSRNPEIESDLHNKCGVGGGGGVDVVDVCGVREDGAILVRPDGHVGWVSKGRGGDDCASMIEKALKAIHGRE